MSKFFIMFSISDGIMNSTLSLIQVLDIFDK
jgi:hypothetical protein